jgi:hypothetical protein
VLINTSAFPVVGSQNELTNLPPRVWGECMSCVELRQEPIGMGDGDTDYVAWAKEHQRQHPTHVRFRLIHSKNFQILPHRPTDIRPIP